MSAFGFDPSIILQGRTASLSDMLQPVREMQAMRAQQASLADLMQRQQQEQQLRGIYQQNADAPEGLSAALMRGGFGQQSFQAQDQAAQMATNEAQRKKMSSDLLELAKQHVRNQVAAVTSPEQYQQLIAGADPQHLAAMGLPTEYDPAKLKMFVAGGVSAEKQRQMTEDERHNREMEKRPVGGGGTIIYGGDGTAFRVAPGGTTAKTVTDENGKPITKPPGGAGDSKEWKDFTNSVSLAHGQGKKLIADLQGRQFASERVKVAATDAFGKAKDLPPELLTELAGATAALISQGHPPESMVHALSPKGWGVTAAELREKLTNAPSPAKQLEYVRMMLALAEREERVVAKQKTQAQAEQLANYFHLREKNPEKFDGILQGVGLDPARVGERGVYRLDDEATSPAGGETARTVHPQANAALDWAKATLKTNPNDPKAKAILERLGVSQ